jgi:hypothetical protein
VFVRTTGWPAQLPSPACVRLPPPQPQPSQRPGWRAASPPPPAVAEPVADDAEAEVTPYEWTFDFGKGAKVYERLDHDGKAYIGLTRKGTVTVNKAVKERWRKHISRAKHEDRDWEIYRYIKQGNWTDWSHEIITVIRGRAEAYAYERELVKIYQPELNDQYM